jgi:hypothetical protein
LLYLLPVVFKFEEIKFLRVQVKYWSVRVL